MSRKKGGGDPRDAFWAAVESQKMDTLRWSLSNCNSLEASTQNEDGLTSFMLACKLDKWKSLQMLVDFYARASALREHGWLECQDERGMTALMYAAEKGSVKCVDYILDAQPQGRGDRRGANAPTMGFELLKQKDKNGNDALKHAVKNKRDNVVELINDFLKPEEQDSSKAEEAKLDADGMTATQRSKAKKREILAQSGGDALKKHEEQDSKYQSRLEEQQAADKAAAAISNRKPVWPEVAKVDSTAELSSKICEVSVVRDTETADCPAHGNKDDPIDPALWDLVMLNRLTLKLPKGLLTAMPSGLARLTALQVLVLSRNSLAALPDAVGDLQTLKVLEAEDNVLTALPDTISNCTKLEVIKVGRNQITSLEPLEKLGSLTIIMADSNKLTSLDGINFKALPRLAELCLQNNQIDEIPDDISGAACLAKIALQDNLITELPGAITQLKKVKEVRMDNNPLSDNKVKKYLEAGGKGLKDLWKYLEKNAKKGGGKKKKKQKKAESSEEEED